MTYYTITPPRTSNGKARVYNKEPLVAEFTDDKFITFYEITAEGPKKVTSSKYNSLIHKYHDYLSYPLHPINEPLTRYFKFYTLDLACIAKLQRLESIRKETLETLENLERHIKKSFPVEVIDAITYWKNTNPELFI